MANEAEVRYLEDKEGNTFIPVAHADYVIGLPENLNDRITQLENDNYYLLNRVYELDQKIENLEKGDGNVLS
ncbi:hypothetical protein [Staphylococcus nepalensis]|uniref:Uncharacterized protein n=1 Tax=Staphylococcus nepalensis TaxID=214473 RepID=A0A380GLU8_9STAP|nr:hypothetical protein [Staphylococcus nepalensis]POA00428.1 hypothetical protein CD130_01800 [Staphylococcus nepalensis]GGB85374.1 hypothetical protein GCM10007203_15730 [Staphylococcus nepalensis]SUM55396.1 Uncharacterised protein [Staphylococcus nepalensis]VDG67369.1 Uncharacterised protein [Lacrimispora indolis]